MAYTWNEANGNAPSRHTTQYFEMLGNRAIYHEGWVAATTPVTQPWVLSTTPPPDIDAYKWELYNVKEDPTQFNDLAAQMPEKVKELQALFDVEAKKYNVLPLDNTTLLRWNTPRPSLTAGRTVFNYSGELIGVPPSASPNTLNKSYTITAEVEVPQGGAEGMSLTEFRLLMMATRQAAALPCSPRCQLSARSEITFAWKFNQNLKKPER